jgi:hypothetical protein
MMLEQVNVLFLKVQMADGSDSLQQLCDGVVSAFAASGLLLPQDEVRAHTHPALLPAAQPSPSRSLLREGWTRVMRHATTTVGLADGLGLCSSERGGLIEASLRVHAA